jgi:hypothetical protein
MLFLYNWSSRLYAELFKGYKAAWGISKQDFLNYPQGSLGYALGMLEFKEFLSESIIELHNSFYNKQLTLQVNPLKHGK